jgi:hypothetical protein
MLFGIPFFVRSTIQMSNCYICHNILNKANTSKEHIISNACGGRLKSYKLLCKACNEKMGADFDSELAKQINPLAVLHNIKRDRKKSATVNRKFDGEPIDSNAVNKSIAKSAIGFFIMKRGDKKFIHHLIPFLLNKEKLDVVEPHLPDESFYHYEPGEVSHFIKLVGHPSERILYCYIGLFNTNGFIVRLNDQYDGPSINKTYIYDLLQSTELKKAILINYTRSQLFSFFPSPSLGI